MKNFLCGLLLLVSVPALCQEWKQYKIDPTVSVNLPKEFYVRDTAGQKSINAKSLFGFMSVTVIPDSSKQVPDIEKKKHLDRYYDSYSRSLGASSKGKLSREVDTLIGDLHVKDFMLETYGPEGHLKRQFRLLHENCATYVFQFMFEARQGDLSKEEQAKFFSSIKAANNPGVASQFTTEPALPKKKRSSTIWIALGAVFLSVVTVIIARRKKKKK